MSLEDLAFLALAAVAVVTALLALLVRELVHTIMWVAVFFVTLAGIYFLLAAPFLGVLQLGVYAGAVTILLLFGVMVTRKRIFSREAATGIGPARLALALGIVVLVTTGAASASTVDSSLAVHAPVALANYLFSTDAANCPTGSSCGATGGGWLILLGLTMLAALSGSIYLVREGRE
ncbi:MAG: NADH-quinone oxidoreductase subunit J [Thermoplasmata archaeon]|nr:NADH-quinone oxidoreductase subunit J [Thermoplasmata archaeon]